MSEHGSIKFWSEIGRRNVLRVAAVYVGFSWMVIHSGVVMGEALEAPHWIMRVVSALLIVGFPAVVAFAWVYELTPEGLKRTVEVEKDASLTHRTAQRLDIIAIGLMIVLAGLYGGERFLSRAEHGPQTAVIEGAPVHEAQPVPAGGITVAVLPFLNLSSDKEQEFFSDGMTEEITSALAKVKGLRVVGRTSAFEFKGQNKDLRTIGKALSASHVLEGSVRKSGNRVRITGQLIKVDDGTHLWTEDYDRELTDVFAVQDDIAHAIAAALQVPLGLRQGEALVPNRIADDASYEDFLRARALYRGRTIGTPLTTLITLGEQILARQPDYAPAWAMLAKAYARATIYEPSFYKATGAEVRRIADENLAKAETAARRAIALDARNADAYVALSQVLADRGHRVQAEDAYKQALAFDPLNSEALHDYSLFLALGGRTGDALPLRQQLRALDPLSPTFNQITALILSNAGNDADALALAQASNNGMRARNVAAISAAMGRRNEAADAVLSLPRETYVAGAVEAAARLLRLAPGVVADEGTPYLGNLSFVFAYVGVPERAIELEERAGTVFVADPLEIWQPAFQTARRTERFKALVRKLGWVDYWRERGWPDHCHAVGKDDFECS